MLKLDLTRARLTYICAFYRPRHGNVERAVSMLDHCYNTFVERPDADLLCLGDMNIDYLTPSPAKWKLNQVLKSLTCTLIINSPTRVTSHTQTLLDHIYCNNTVLYCH